MEFINYYPEGKENIKIVDENVNVIILPTTTKRLEIGYAPQLKKIISLSPELIIGPETKKADNVCIIVIFINHFLLFENFP